jgi:hypothetical protein
MSETLEPFVTAEVVADFLSMPRAQVLKLTHSGSIRAYPVSGIERHVWKYRLSEVSEDIAARQKPARSTMVPGSPRSFVTKEKYGTE